MMNSFRKHMYEWVCLLVVIVGVFFLTQRFMPQPQVVETPIPATPESISTPTPTPSPSPLTRLGDWLDAVLGHLVDGLGGLFARLNGVVEIVGAYVASWTPSDWIGWLLVTLAVVLFLWRARSRYIASLLVSADPCPRCGGHTHRVHRTWTDRVWGALLLVSLQRYACADRACGWSGLHCPEYAQLLHRSHRMPRFP